MKNVHILPTDKPSRIYSKNGNYKLDTSTMAIDWYISSACYKPQHIYITSDEEIKEGDWYFDGTDLVHKKTKHNDSLVDGNKNSKKIILTTDQDLIKDGVQSIDDEFLEWFVKNPNCEWVKTKLVPINELGSEITVNGYGFDRFIYKLIIPKEETKQKWDINTCRYWNMEIGCEREKCICENTPIEEPEQETLEEVCCNCGKFWYNTTDRLNVFCFLCGKSKQETLEEAAEKAYRFEADPSFPDETEHQNFLRIFKKGTKWQQERMFEIMNEYTDDVMGGCNLRAKEWFEQFKKK